MSDPLDAGFASVDPLLLDSWQSEAAVEADAGESVAAEATADGEELTPATASAMLPFPIDAGINSKLVLWSGDLAALKATAIVNVSNENLGDRNPLSMRILHLGGPALRREVVENVKTCKTGEAKLTKGYLLPARFVIHTVGPRYNAQYRTAAESALYNSTRAVLEQVLERSMDTLGFAPIHTVWRGYPPEEGAHLTLRCLRRFLERHGAGLARLVIVTDEATNAACYRQLAPVYFPRSEAELRLSRQAVDGACLGGPMGEPLHRGRGIRIGASPLGGQSSNDSRDTSPSPPPIDAAKVATSDSAALPAALSTDITGAVDASVAGVGSHAFSRMEQSPDNDASRRNRRTMAAGAPRQPAEIRADRLLASERRYERWLRRARQQDLSRLRTARCLFHSGHDVHGRPVVVAVASRLLRPAHRNYEELALLVLSALEPLIGQPYVVLYAHSGYDALPHSAFLRELRDLLMGDPRWSTNLACLIHLHADRRTRLFWWWFARFSSNGLCQQFANCLQEVFQLVGPDQLDLPDSVYELDRKVAKETKSGVGKQLGAAASERTPHDAL